MLERGIVFAVLLLASILFVVGRWRYDLVAVMALLVLAATGVVAPEHAYAGFGHPAVITVAAVLVISRGLENAGVVDLVARGVQRVGDRPVVELAVLTVLAAVLSGFMNNTGALALLMPVAVQTARKAGRSPSRLLMPLAFASLLGGLVTLIGTPPNIIISTLRRAETGQAFRMFDFAPVGAGVASLGLLLLILAARLVPRRAAKVSQEDLFELEAYTSEVRVPEGSPADGKPLGEVLEGIEDVVVVVLVRASRRIHAPASHEVIRAGDSLVVEADTQALQNLVKDTGLAPAGGDATEGDGALASENVRLVEAVVRPDSFAEGRAAGELYLRRFYRVNLLAVAREGKRITERLSRIRFRAGDVLLLQGELPSLQEAMRSLGCLPLADREIRVPGPRRLLPGVTLFAAAVAAGAVGVLPIETAFASAAALFIVLRIVTLREAYDALDLPVLVLLGAMLPVGEALDTSGGAQLLADGLLEAGSALPVWVTLLVLLLSTSVLSNVMNNAAVTVVMAPVAMAIARGLDSSIDPFLMAVAVGAASAFMTPVGHQSNALVMGPGGYRFADYWRLGLPLTLAVAAGGIPLILWAWPP
ncbi:MAG: SLC13 family permease [Myxococcota bacterium]